MHEIKSERLTPRKPLRLWPGIVLAILLVISRYLLPVLSPEMLVWGIMGGFALAVLIIFWWLFFSRAALIERLGALLIMAGSFIISSFFLHESIATGGQGMMFAILCAPVLGLTFVGWAVITSRLTTTIRRWSMPGVIVISCGVWLLLRSDGITGDFNPDLVWRWSPTAEERLLAEEPVSLEGVTASEAVLDSVAEWPGFRGPGRDATVHGTTLSEDWSSHAPVELWRHEVGPGCSSFAIVGDYFFTQEQRGENELVVCYRLHTGEPVWTHSDQTRFWDSHAGAGPRATPTYHNGRIFTMGGTGILNALDARTGSLIWSRNAAADAKTIHSGWGYTGSPLVVGDVVIAAVVGKLTAFDTETGEPRWFGPDGGSGYSSPHLMVIDSLPQVLLMSEKGAISIDPASGHTCWKYDWPVEDRILQPARIAGNDLLLSQEYTSLRRVSVVPDGDGFSIRERWSAPGVQVNFNDHVIHKGFAFAFDGPTLVCLDMSDGSRKWNGARYRGWTLLLPDQDLLLILTEKGELALVKATPERFTELGRIRAIEGKTWNHPALAGDVILVRNNREMAAFRLPLAGSDSW